MAAVTIVRLVSIMHCCLAVFALLSRNGNTVCHSKHSLHMLFLQVDQQTATKQLLRLPLLLSKCSSTEIVGTQETAAAAPVL